MELSMRADSAEVSWNPAKNKWLLRIRVGEEVIRRYCGTPKTADEETIKSVVQQTLKDDGYDPDPKELTIRR